MAGASVGIDLGTTYSLVAYVRDGEPQILPNALGEALTPSAVSVLESGEIVVGAAARARAVTHPESTAQCFKRDMGTRQEHQLGARRLSPEELSALVLGALKHDAESALGMPIEEAVVTVPAYFGELQRRATRDACELAGLPVERIINEPTAAALAYGLHQRERELSAVVLDLGGGTFDVTVLEIMEGVIEIQASAGDTRLGGEDFVDLMVEHVAARIQTEYALDALERIEDRARLRDACELAKRRLSADDSARLALPGLGAERVDVQVELTNEELETLWQPLFERLRVPVRRALRDARKTAEAIDEVLLVGGATRMPSVVRLAANIFGRLPLRSLPPDEAVALGAAVQVALKRGDSAVSDMVVTDIAPFTLGISVVQTLGNHQVSGIFSPILERGTVLPASRVERFWTVHHGQRSITIEVYQGEHSLCARNQKLGEYTVHGIPARPPGEESIDVRFTYDMNGILDVDTTVTSTKQTTTLTIERSPGRMSERELAAARKRLQGLKLHPRDALPNVTALARAEALYQELTGVERQMLGEAIGRFRAALEAQRPSDIEPARAALQQLMAALRS